MFFQFGTSVVNYNWIYMVENLQEGTVLHYKAFGRDQKIALNDLQRHNFFKFANSQIVNLDLVLIPPLGPGGPVS